MMRRLFLAVLLAALARPALAVAPVDGDGDFVHALTLHPARMTRPMPLQGPVRFFAQAADDKGGMLIMGDGEYLTLDGEGRLDRSAFAAATAQWPTFGSAALLGGHLYYCDGQAKAIRDISQGGRSNVEIGKGAIDAGMACGLYRDATGGFTVVQPFPYLAWHVSGDGRVLEKFAYDFPLRKPGAPVRPCGVETGGRPIGALEHHEGHDVALVRLDGRLMPETTLWTLDYADQPLAAMLKSVRLLSVNGCSYGGGHATFWLHNQAIVFRGKELVSWLRGDPNMNPSNPHVMSGIGPYAMQILMAVQVLGNGNAVLAVERDHGDLRLYAKKVDVPVAEARQVALAAQKAGHPLRAHLAWDIWRAAHPEDADALAQQTENMAAAGWWEEADDKAKEALDQPLPADVKKRLTGLHARLRAQMLLRWNDRPMMVGSLPITLPDSPLPAYLAEAEKLALLAPEEPLVHRAAARLALALQKRSLYLQHLEPLAALLKNPANKPSAYPELFDLLAARGDADGLARMVQGLAPDAPPELALRWRAVALRTQGKFADALQVLGEPGDDRPALLALKATLEGDAGRFGDAIGTWTRALSKGLDGDPDAQAGMGVAYLRRGLSELAVQALLKAVNADPDNAAYRSNLVQAYAALDKRDDAMQQIFGALAKNPKDPLLRFQLDALSAQKPAAAGNQEATLAILPLATAGGAVQRVGIGEMLAAMLTTAVLEGGGPPVVERSRLAALLQEQKLQQSSHVDPETAVRLGKLLGAKQLLLGNAAEFEGLLSLDVRLVDSQTGKVLAAAHGRAELDVDALRKAVATLAGKLVALRAVP